MNEVELCTAQNITWDKFFDNILSAFIAYSYQQRSLYKPKLYTNHYYISICLNIFQEVQDKY